jgi:inhibitor of cysteine peptidase
MRLTEQDNGAEITVRKAEEIIIALPENPTTGYRWSVEASGDALALDSADYAPATTAVGAGGKRTMRFIAQRPGTSTIHAQLRRSWEDPKAAINAYTVTIAVTGIDHGNDR